MICDNPDFANILCEGTVTKFLNWPRFFIPYHGMYILCMHVKFHQLDKFLIALFALVKYSINIITIVNEGKQFFATCGILSKYTVSTANNAITIFTLWRGPLKKHKSIKLFENNDI